MRHQQTDRVQTTTLAHRLQATATSVVEKTHSAHEEQNSPRHSTLLAPEHAHELEGAACYSR